MAALDIHDNMSDRVALAAVTVSALVLLVVYFKRRSLLSQAVEEVDRRVVVLASGGLSHRFWPLMEFADHESASLENIRTPEAREADQKVLRWWDQGDHRQVIDYQPEYRTHAPEGFFGHYMMMVGSIGGKDCVATGLRYSEYESAAGTGQVHMWFERPDGGWTAQD